MKKINYGIAALLFVAIVPLSGCMFYEPFKTVQYFDLQTPSPIITDDSLVKVEVFSSTETGKYKMVYTEDDCRVVIDDYNKWLQPPGVTLSRYIQTAFSNNSTQPKTFEFNVSGNVFLYKIDLKNKLASLGVLYKIAMVKGGGETELINHSCILTSSFQNNDDPADFAKAMSDCAKLLACRIKADIEYLKQNSNDNSQK